MNVELINAEQVKDFFKNFGSVAAVCYNSPEKYAERIGKSCLESGHLSGSRGDYFKFKISGVPRFTMDQAVRATTGVLVNCQSFRYVDKDNFSYDVPTEILDNQELLTEYKNYMEHCADMYEKIQKHVTDKGKPNERANESARYVLPISTQTEFVFGLDLEALMHFMNVRLCNRAEDKIRKMANLMKDEVLKVLPELESYLVPTCEKLHWCPEHKSCGKCLTEKDLTNLLNKGE